MNYTCRVDNAQLIAKLRKGQKRLRYAVVNALNGTALDIQKEIRAGVRRRMTVRRTTFIERQAAVIKFASVRSAGLPYVEVSVGQKPRLLLPLFEEGGERKPFVGEHVALPVIGGPARTTLAAKVPGRLTFEQFGFMPTQSRQGRHVYIARDRRFYLIAGVGVFMRTPRGSKLVYYFRKPFKLDERLHFYATAQRVTNKVFRKRMEHETAEAIRFSGR